MVVAFNFQLLFENEFEIFRGCAQLVDIVHDGRRRDDDDTTVVSGDLKALWIAMSETTKVNEDTEINVCLCDAVFNSLFIPAI